MLKILEDQMAIGRARNTLIGRGLSVMDSPLRAWMRRLRMIRGIAVGDRVKSWDLLCTIECLEQYLKKDDPILDIGCFSSEILVALHRLGYTQLTGMDLNPRVRDMPHADAIRYEIADFMQSGFPDASFSAITAISVIEHGFQPERLVKEISRLLKPGGIFIASFDYWPEKIDTDGTLLFGMSWTLFSEKEVSDFIGLTAQHGLSPVGPMQYAAPMKVIHFGGKQYTFAWMALVKSAGS